MFQEENDDYVVFLLEYAASSMQHTLWMYSIFVLELKVDGRNKEFFQVLESKVCNFIMPQILDSPGNPSRFPGLPAVEADPGSLFLHCGWPPVNTRLVNQRNMYTLPET